MNQLNKIIKIGDETNHYSKKYDEVFNSLKNDEEYKNFIFKDVEYVEDFFNGTKIKAIPCTILYDRDENVLCTLYGYIDENKLKKVFSTFIKK